MMYDAIIVGGGHNGLVCAGYLARAGLDVLVLERRHVVGGACATEELLPGYHFSTCSYVAYILQDKVVADLALREHGYQVHQLPNKRFFPFPDGRSLVMWNDRQRTVDEISRTFSRRDAEGYVKLQDFWWQAGSLFNEFYLSCDPPTVEELQARLAGTEQEALLDQLLHRPLPDLLDELFDAEEVMAAAISHVMAFNGLDEPGLLFAYAATKPNVLTDPRNQGVVVGGMGGISQALARSARSAGAQIRCGAEVQRILMDNEGRAEGVELIDGQIIRARRVISNADPKRTFLKLLADAELPPGVTEEVTGLSSACGTFKFHAAVNELPDLQRFFADGYDPRLVVDTGICPSLDYYRQSVADAQAGRPSSCPIIDVQIPTVYDRTVVPEGKHIVSMWVRFEPVQPMGTTWDALRRQEGERLIDLFSEYAPNFRDSIIDWMLYTPADLERRVYLTDGNFRHTDHVPGQLLGGRLFGRGGHRTPLKGLYMCGAGTHPGGDVSGAPGHNAAQAVLQDLGR